MELSVRRKLTLWYVTLLTVSLVLLSVSFYIATKRVYLSNIDGNMEKVASTMIHTIVKPPGELKLPRNFDVMLEKFFGIKTAGNYIQVRNSFGRVVAMSSNISNINLPMSEKAYEQAKLGHDTYETVRSYGLFPVRVLTKPVVMKDFGLFAVIQVGSSLEDMDLLLSNMFRIFVVGIIVSVLIASIIGSFLALKALRPVGEMVAIARRIGAENLNERITVHGHNDEIGELATTLNEMIERLEKSFTKIKQFTADASHELKTPLTVMKGEVEVALRTELEQGEAREILESNLEEIDRMYYIIRNLLTLAKADAEEEDAMKMAVRFDIVVSERFELISRSAATKGVEFELVSTDEATVFADPVGLGQVVSNLMDNAIKYTPVGGRVEVGLELYENEVKLKVRDSGIGIVKEELPYIFDRFYRTDKARTRSETVTGSVGLGLSICRDLLELYNGKIEAMSTYGKGSTFVVTLPLAKLGEDESE
ncbi:MAG: HAMP domain-containing protein [Deltaproteobacteria bacterium]|nr:HAMP domain-containing protein [Deltaproteobacteria bacterium]